MALARILALKATSFESCVVSAAIEGRLEVINPASCKLGESMAPLDLQATLYPHLSELEVTSGGAPTGRLKFDSTALRNELKPYCPFAVSASETGALLDQWIARRQSTWRSRYQHIAQVATLVRNATTERLDHLDKVAAATQAYLTAATVAYEAAGGAIDRVGHPTMTTDNLVAAVATRHRQTVKTHNGDETAAVVATHINESSLMIPATYEQTDPKNPAMFDWKDRTENTPTILVQQSISRSDEFVSPLAEAIIRSRRLLADLEAERLEEHVLALRLPHLEEIWNNELLDIDLEIRKIQLAYIDCFLFSPIGGRVSATYRRAGEFVRRGEAVFMVEKPDVLELTGQLRSPLPIHVGAAVRVRTKDAFKDSTALELIGVVTACRGYDANSDRWNVVLRCQNPGDAIPIGYDFETDPSVTSVEIG